MSKDILITVDMQDDFIVGSLAVPNAKAIIPKVNRLLKHFKFGIMTKDWHPANHKSFASVMGVAPFTKVDSEMRWPDHCVAGTQGAEIWKDLDLTNVKMIIHKGTDEDVESYSAFENAEYVDSGLTVYLKANDVKRVFVCGLALDYCVQWTADHAVGHFETFIISDATASVDPNFLYSDENVKMISTEEAIQKTP